MTDTEVLLLLLEVLDFYRAIAGELPANVLGDLFEALDQLRQDLLFLAYRYELDS